MSTDHVCTEKDTLQEIKDTLKELHLAQMLMHKKLYESNGERALVEIIRENTEFRIKTQGLAKKVILAWVASVVGLHGLDKLVGFFLQ